MNQTYYLDKIRRLKTRLTKLRDDELFDGALDDIQTEVEQLRSEEDGEDESAQFRRTILEGVVNRLYTLSLQVEELKPEYEDDATMIKYEIRTIRNQIEEILW